MNEKRGRHSVETMLFVVLILITMITIVSMFWYRRTIAKTTEQTGTDGMLYDKHYVFISEDYSNPLMEQIYEGIRQAAEKTQVYVEYFGKKLPVEYSIAELIEIAINAKVDGIFVVGDGTKEEERAINRAVSKQIPVITVFQDSVASKRQSFIGVNGYELGQQYAKKLLSLAEDSSQAVYILISSGEERAEKNSVYLGIQEYLESKRPSNQIHLHGVTIKSKTEFTSEEMVRELILDEKKKPDMLICLNSIDTSCAYQAVVDYNKVGQVRILGWGNTELILNAIRNHIIDGTITIDVSQLGSLAMQAMTEYVTTGNVSEYAPVPITMIDTHNLAQYIE